MPESCSVTCDQLASIKQLTEVILMKKHQLKFVMAALVLPIFTLGILTPVYAQGGKGMTWGFRGFSFPHSTIPFTPQNRKRVMLLGCHAFKHDVNPSNPPSLPVTNHSQSCNAYVGETSCTETRPILCIKESGNLKRPPYKVRPGGELYAGWAPRVVKLKEGIQGTQLTSRAVADNLCGAGWKMASHHDGRWIQGMGATSHFGNSWNLSNTRQGGWSFHARVNAVPANNPNHQSQINRYKAQRYWVAVNDQPSNCWNP